LAALSTGAVAAGTVRVLIGLQYRKHNPAIGDSMTAVRYWQYWYESSAAVYAACLGGMGFVAFVFADDPISQLLLTTTAVVYMAGAMARNSSWPRVAVTQLTLTLLPIAIGSALRRDIAYTILSAVVLLYCVAALEIVKSAGASRLRLLLTTREKDQLAHSLAEQNFRFDTALANMPHGLCMFDTQLRLLVWNRRFCEIFGIPTEVLSRGMAIKQLVELSFAHGNGIGYSSMALVKTLPIDALKIDRSFVREIASDVDDKAHCRGDHRARPRARSHRRG
jgi:PAS domain-containing protein